jgi:methionine aminopeptidase
MKENKAVGVMKPGQIFTIEPMINAGCVYTFLYAGSFVYYFIL